MKPALAFLQTLVGTDKPLRYFCEDESRWGLLTHTGRMITLKGTKPEGIYQWGRKTFWLYGLVEPLTGDSYFECLDTLNSETFEAFIERFALSHSDCVIVMQLDRASAHRANTIDWPENIIPLCQPAYTPEVNPIERLWEYLKALLDWELFEDIGALRQRVLQLIDDLSADLVQSITGWDFIVDAVLSSSSS